MFKTTRRILKADQVTLDDPLALGLDAPSRRPGAGTACVPSGPSVRIAQNHPQYAIIEVTCACGETTYVRCEYAAANPAPVRQASGETVSA
jgi:hypothetical protein